MIHIIEASEATLHIQSEYCPCDPVIEDDFCIHLPLTTPLKGVELDYQQGEGVPNFRAEDQYGVNLNIFLPDDDV